MCGIVGYVGKREAVPILLDGLKRLEYRGYDSAGVAVLDDKSLGVLRAIGKLSNLDELIGRRPLRGSVGLGHTRWATHGGPSEANAHPHMDCGASLAVIHNGIIENYAPLKAGLIADGHLFKSATDTEVIAHLMETKLAWLKTVNGRSPEQMLAEALRLTLKDLRGSYALAVIWAQAPGVIAAAKADSPLVIGIGDGEHFMASDVPAFLKHTRKVVFMEDGELVLLDGKTCSFLDCDGNAIDKKPTLIEWDSAVAEKSGYSHFMLKEIHEQPNAVRNTLRGRLAAGELGGFARDTGLTDAALAEVRQVHIVACGTSWHAGIIGKYLLERRARVQTQVETASEFRYRQPILAPGTLVVAISQSGETADTLAAVRLARQSKAQVLSICNAVGAAIPRASDFVLQTCCGQECGVASTKAFTGQLTALHLLALRLAVARRAISAQAAAEWAEELQSVPALLEETLTLDARVREIALRFWNSAHFLFIGRGVNFPVALEGALKLKEISYIHAEGYPAGEMKHGPLALIDSEMPVVAIATRSDMLEKLISNVEEARSRGAKVIALCTRGDGQLGGKASEILELPAAGELISPILNVVPLQLLAYHVALLRGCDIDQPRNLAKSVTVE